MKSELVRHPEAGHDLVRNLRVVHPPLEDLDTVDRAPEPSVRAHEREDVRGAPSSRDVQARRNEGNPGARLHLGQPQRLSHHSVRSRGVPGADVDDHVQAVLGRDEPRVGGFGPARSRRRRDHDPADRAHDQGKSEHGREA